MVALASLPYLSELKHLELHDNNLGPAGARALASSPYLSQLTYIGLSYNEIGDEGAQALATSPYLCSSIRQLWRRA